MSSSPDAGRRRGPGRPPSLTPDAIADAVLAVGFPALTFAAVAAHLGVGQATLYRHVPDRDELARLGLDLALRRTGWPDLDGDWRSLLERWAVAAWRAWERHPGAVAELTRGVLPPSILGLSDQVGGALVARGFTARDAVLAVDLVFDLVADNRRGVELYDAPSPASGGHPRRSMEDEWSVPPSEPTAAALRAEMVRAIRTPPIDWFVGKLRIVLAGIEATLAPPPS